MWDMMPVWLKHDCQRHKNKSMTQNYTAATYRQRIDIKIFDIYYNTVIN